MVRDLLCRMNGLARKLPPVTARFERPTSLDDATALLAAGGWAVLAGGTDLYPAHVGRPIATPLLDIGALAALRGISADANGWRFGATTTWRDLQRAALPRRFDALLQASREIGGVQIQNTGTLGGNLCNASPAADGTPVWLALDADVLLASRSAARRMPVADFVLGSRRTAMRADELVTGLQVPTASPRARSIFLKLGGRRYLTISMTMVAVALDTDAAGRIVRLGIAVGSCSARALRLPSLAARLIGEPLAALARAEVNAADLAALAPIDDLRASAAYRLDASATLLRRAFAALSVDPPTSAAH